MKIIEQMEVGKKYQYSGHCTGIVPEGTELKNFGYGEYNTVNNGRLSSGPRLKKNMKYLLNGKEVICTQSGFSDGDAYYPGSWSFTIEYI